MPLGKVAHPTPLSPLPPPLQVEKKVKAAQIIF